MPVPDSAGLGKRTEEKGKVDLVPMPEHRAQFFARVLTKSHGKNVSISNHREVGCIENTRSSRVF